jgi:hypothetical protein
MARFTAKDQELLQLISAEGHGSRGRVVGEERNEFVVLPVERGLQHAPQLAEPGRARSELERVGVDPQPCASPEQIGEALGRECDTAERARREREARLVGDVIRTEVRERFAVSLVFGDEPIFIDWARDRERDIAEKRDGAQEVDSEDVLGTLVGANAQRRQLCARAVGMLAEHSSLRYNLQRVPVHATINDQPQPAASLLKSRPDAFREADLQR